MRQTQAVEAATFPFRERLLPFLSHLENLWPVIDSVSIKKKKRTAAQGRTQTSDLEPEPFVS